MTGDRARDAALLGAAWLVYAGESGDDAAFATGLGYLDRAAAQAPEHPDRSDWWTLLGLGYACLDGSPGPRAVTALDAGIAALERGAARTGERAAWYDLGEAYLLRWRVGGSAESVFQAGRCLDRVLAPGTPDDALGLSAHLLRLHAAFEAGERVDTVRLRAVLADSGRALDRVTAPGWAVLAGLLAFGELWVAGYDGGSYDTVRVRHRIALARRVPDPPPEWTALLDTVESLAYFADEVTDAGASGERAIAAYARTVRGYDGDVLPFLLHLRAARAGDLRGMDSARSMLAARTGDSAILTRAVLALERARWGDRDGVETLAAQVNALVAGLPDDHVLVPMLGFARGLGADDDRLVTLPDTVASDVEPGDIRAVGLLLTGASAAVQAVHQRNRGALAAAAGYLDRLATAIPAGHALRLAAAGLAANAWRDLARESGPAPRPDEPDELAATRRVGSGGEHSATRAVRWFEEMVAATGGPRHPLWAAHALGLAESLRLAGDPDRARTRALGLAALRGYAWQVLAQAGTDYALRAAATVAAHASQVTGWCLSDGAYDELLPVLDAGRGLALAAAATSRSVADRLTALGEPDLATEWLRTNGLGRDRRTGTPLPERAAPAEVPDDLRDRVVRALSGGASEEVTLDEVRSALRATGSDALVYLLPTPGTAVVVPCSGPVEVIPLPRLRIGPEIGRWLADRDGWSLDRLCARAFTAAVQRLLGYTHKWGLSRPARLVLVPMGALGLVPWHAAYTGSGTGRRYAIADLVLSYSVSARMFCAAARHPLRPIGSALVVGNPGDDLPYAGAEARAIHRRFHPGGVFLGEGGEKATPDRVLAWIAEATGPSLLHLACHGWVDPSRPADAHLVLADGARLSAGTLLEATRLAGLPVDQVYLAACTTHAIGTDYDESFSLATAFLAAGAQTVFGSLWPVPDADTSLLMYLVHQHLTVDGNTPVDALHRAQRWMTDPYRRPPDGMPVELVRAAWGRSPAQPGAWAGFIHLGR
jgi:hypothetical protein